MKAIIVKATGAQVQFGVNAPATKRNLEAVGVTIGLSTIKLIQNGSKTQACGIEVVELKEEKKVKAKRVSKVWEQFVAEHPELKKVEAAGFTHYAAESKHHKRVCFKKGDVKVSVNFGKRGFYLVNLVTRDKAMFNTVDGIVKAIIA